MKSNLVGGARFSNWLACRDHYAASECQVPRPHEDFVSRFNHRRSGVAIDAAESPDPVNDRKASNDFVCGGKRKDWH